MRRWCTLVAYVSAIASMACTAATSSALPDGWIVQDVPTDSAVWTCANWSPSEWSVAVGAAMKLEIVPAPAWRPRIHRPMADGYFELENLGEFGGHVTWVDSGSRARTKLLDTHPTAITEGEGRFWLWSGLAHLFGRSGQVTELMHRSDGGWQLGEGMELPSTPRAVLPVASDTVLVVTPDGILSVEPSHETSRWLFRSEHWYQLYAKSIARDASGVLYVGMRHAVARLSPQGKGYHEEWLVPVTCKRLIPSAQDAPCGCSAT